MSATPVEVCVPQIAEAYFAQFGFFAQPPPDLVNAVVVTISALGRKTRTRSPVMVSNRSPQAINTARAGAPNGMTRAPVLRSGRIRSAALEVDVAPPQAGNLCSFGRQ